MLLTQETLEGIENGSISLQFRRWKRPTVKAGGTLLTTLGVLAIEAVDAVDVGDITPSEAAQAGFPDLESLLAMLDRRTVGDLYRVRLSLLGADPRIALREKRPAGADLDRIVARLARLDERSPRGPWTRVTLRLIRKRPGERAAELAESVGIETARFKTDVRKLKGLGLTESLRVGYRLSPRGDVVLKALDERGGASP